LSGDEGSERTASAPFFETPSFAAFRGADAISDRGSRQAAGLRLPGGVPCEEGKLSLAAAAS